MSPAALSTVLIAAAAAVTLVRAQAVTGTFPAVPLASKHFAYPSGVPYQADTDTGLIRGGQAGYNLCNSTTEGQNSLCQTSFVNAVDDFCLWAPPKPNSTIADTEGEEVAWCTKPGRGTRLIPAGALYGVQFMRTPDYLQVVGFIDQRYINIQDGDFGGELDPHGADLRGNPLGGLMYSNGWSNGNNNSYTQVIEWNNFMGGNQFCIKVCNPAGANAANYCQHIYDRIGCAYNSPNNAQNGTFEACLGDDQDFPGIYTVNGQVMTYSQPPESLGPITTLPYTPRVPASSSCVQYTSSVLYAALASVTPAPGNLPSTSPSGTATGSGSNPTNKPSSSGSSSSGSSKPSNDASVVVMSGLVSVMGVLVSALFLS